MKKILIQTVILNYIFFLINISNIVAQTTTKNKMRNLYPFANYYLNLDTFEKVEENEKIAHHFKTDSKFSQRFEIPIWFNQYPTQVIFNESTFTTDEKGNLQFYNTHSSTSIPKNIENKENAISLDNKSGNNFLLTIPTGVIHIKRLDSKHGYRIYKYDEKGKILFQVDLEHTKIIKKDNTYHHKPYLSFLTYTDEYLVFTSYDREYPSTQLVNTDDGKITSLPFTANGIIRDENENSITDLIRIIDKDSFQKINMLTQKSVWGKKIDYYLSDNYRVETIEKDAILVLCFYNPISTGSGLYAYSKATGELIWKADVKQLNVPHSEYYNTVIVSLYKDVIIMEGIEAEGHYLQLFDIHTGKRLYSSF